MQQQSTTLSTLLQCASDRIQAGHKKPTKPKAEKLLEHVAGQLLGNGQELDRETLQALGGLYQHFMPAPPPKPKTDWHWVAGAVPKNDVRYFLNYVHADSRYIAGTDGHALHILPNTEGLPEGFYMKSEEPRRVDLGDTRYPDIYRVIPREGQRGSLTYSPEAWPIEDVHGVKAYKLNGGHLVNVKLMDAALSRPKQDRKQIEIVEAAGEELKIDAWKARGQEGSLTGIKRGKAVKQTATQKIIRVCHKQEQPQYRLAEECPEVVMVTHGCSEDIVYLGCETPEEAAELELSESPATVMNAGHYAEPFSAYEVLEAANEGFGWPVAAGLVEEVRG